MEDLKITPKAKNLLIGLFITLVIGGTTYLITNQEGYNPYICEESNVVGLCWKLSNLNSDNISTRCYWNESAPRRYKKCSSGWKLYNNLSVTGNITDIPELNKVITLDIISKNLTEYKLYDYNLSNGRFERCLLLYEGKVCMEFDNKEEIDVWEKEIIEQTIRENEELENISKTLVSITNVEIN